MYNQIFFSLTPIIFVICGAGCTAGNNTKTPVRKLHVSKLDGGKLTGYDWDSVGGVKEIAGTSIRRTFFLVNDPTCPIEITAFGFHVTKAEPILRQIKDATLRYDLRWTLTPRTSVAQWEAHNLTFDSMNRFLWRDTNGNGPETGEAGDLPALRPHSAARVHWWTTGQTGHLGKWVTSILYIGKTRTTAGDVWVADNAKLLAEVKNLGFDIP